MTEDMPYTATFFDFKELPEISKGSDWLKHELMKIKTGWEEEKPNSGIGEDNDIPYSQLVGKICVSSREVYIEGETGKSYWTIVHSRSWSGPEPSHL
jgi:hypothetical protein